MPSLPMLPETAPFPADQITALNRIMSVTSVEQRTWLRGFLAGYQAANGPQAAAAASPPRRAPLTILFGTESGNAEALADVARKAAGKLGFAARVLDMADATPAQIAGVQNLLVIASTWGEGDPPQHRFPRRASGRRCAAPRGCSLCRAGAGRPPTRNSAKPAGCSTNVFLRLAPGGWRTGSNVTSTTRRRPMPGSVEL
jgi:Flavodoxin